MNTEEKAEGRFPQIRKFLNRKIFGKISYKIIMGTILGALAGLIYFHFWGCRNGCPLKSNPWTMMGIGFLFGGVLFSDIK